MFKHSPLHAWFLKIAFVRELSMCICVYVCVCVCVRTRVSVVACTFVPLSVCPHPRSYNGIDI